MRITAHARALTIGRQYTTVRPFASIWLNGF